LKPISSVFSCGCFNPGLNKIPSVWKGSEGFPKHYGILKSSDLSLGCAPLAVNSSY
jgi:hypothetical protein